MMSGKDNSSDGQHDAGHGHVADPSNGCVEIDGVLLKLSQPYTGSAPWIGQREILLQLLACWITVDESDLPLTPRLVGSPGMGKTQLVIAAAKEQGLPLYIYQCTADTRPEDLLVTPVLGQNGSISY
ncbi:MAG: AAA family ATPase, partial [Rubripirellula sp.]